MGRPNAQTQLQLITPKTSKYRTLLRSESQVGMAARLVDGSALRGVRALLRSSRQAHFLALQECFGDKERVVQHVLCFLRFHNELRRALEARGEALKVVLHIAEAVLQLEPFRQMVVELLVAKQDGERGRGRRRGRRGGARRGW